MAKSKKKTNNRKTKNDNSKKIENVGRYDLEVWNKIFVALGVICFLLLFYLLTLYITNKHSDDSTTTATDDVQVEANISYEEILLGRSLSMSSGEYFVIYYDGSDEEISSDYSELVSNYRAKEEHLPIYFVDMSSGFNKSYVTEEESNKTPATVEDFAINGPTLIKVNENKVVDYIEGLDSIKNQLS